MIKPILHLLAHSLYPLFSHYHLHVVCTTSFTIKSFCYVYRWRRKRFWLGVAYGLSATERTANDELLRQQVQPERVDKNVSGCKISTIFRNLDAIKRIRFLGQVYC